MYPPLAPELFSAFLEHTPVAVAMFDSQMRYLLASRRWLTDYGLEKQDLIGRSHYEVFPNVPNHWRELHQRCLTGAVEWCDIARFVRPDGRVEWVKWEVYPWRHLTGEIGGLIVFTEAIAPAQWTKETLPEPMAEFELRARGAEGEEKQGKNHSPSLSRWEPNSSPASPINEPKNLLPLQSGSATQSRSEATHQGTTKFQVSGFNLEWQPTGGSCTFDNHPIVMMWLNTTLAKLMVALQAMVGDKRFSLALQNEGRKSVEYDLQVISQFSDFQEGFAAIARVAKAGGWGNWQLVSVDEEHKECCFQISNSWEALYQKTLGVCWGSDMLAGKLAGYCSKLFETNCWAQQTAFIAKGDEFDEFVVRPSTRLIEQEIDKLLECDSATCADLAVALQNIQREIADRKRTQEALRATEARFQKLAANMPGAIYQLLLRPDGSKSIVYISSGCRDLYELEPEAIQEDYDRLWTLIHPDDLQALQESIFVSAETLIPRNHEARIITPSGKLKWIQAVARPERLEGGEILWDGLLLDITKRKQAEEQLQQYKEHLEELVAERTAALTQVNEQLQQEIAERKRTQEALLESQTRLTLLNSISTGMNSDMSVEQLIERTVQLISECFKTLRVAYSILDDQGKLTVINAIDPPGMPPITGLVASLTTAPEYLSALYRDKLVLVEDVAQDNRMAPLATAMLAGGTRAVLDVPLEHSEQLVGLLCFDSPEPRKWSEHEIATLTEIAEYLSIAINKSRAQQEREQAEEALRQSEVRFQKLAANVPGMIYQYRLHPDGSRSFPYVSPGCRELYEREPEEIQQKADLVFDQIHPDERGEVEHSLAVSAQTLQPWGWEWRIVTPSGQIKWVQGVSRAEKQANGDILWDGVLIDISDRKLAEEAQRLSEANFRRLAQQEAILNRLANQIRNSLDLNTIQQTLVDQIRELLQLDRCHIAWYRPRLEPPAWEVVTEAKIPSLSSHLGYHSAAELGSLAERLRRLELIRVDSVETLNDPGKQQLLLSLGYTAILALPTRTRTGEVIILSCVHCSFSRQWTNDQVELLQAVMAQLAIAVTHAELYEKTRTKAQELEQALGELQRTQTQLVQSEKMSSLGQLVAGVAHEINNPVSFISGNVGHASDYVKDLLRLLELYRATYPQSTAEIQALAEEIELDFLMEDLPKVIDSMKVGATRIEKIVGSLRTFSRVDQSDRKPVNLHEDLDNTLLILEHRLKATGGHPQIEVIKEYGNLPPVECYAAQMNQVFMNLLSNAIDAIEEAQQQATKGNTEESGLKPKLAIKTQIVDTNCVSITITDNGTGIPPDVLSRMFDLFFTTKPIGKGTGLGLAISYQIIVEKHGGSLNCHSVPGKGTEFVIEIPIKQL